MPFRVPGFSTPKRTERRPPSHRPSSPSPSTESSSSIVNRPYLQRKGQHFHHASFVFQLVFLLFYPGSWSISSTTRPVSPSSTDATDTNSIFTAGSSDGSWAPTSSHVEPIRSGARRPARPWRLIRGPSPIIRGHFCCPRRRCSSPVRPIGAEPQSNCEFLMSSLSASLFFVSVSFTRSACLGSSRPACELDHQSSRLHAQRLWGSLSQDISFPVPICCIAPQRFTSPITSLFAA